jgi:hypothetical protein
MWYISFSFHAVEGFTDLAKLSTRIEKKTSLEQSSWEADSCWATTEFVTVFVHKSPPLGLILSQMNPAHKSTLLPDAHFHVSRSFQTSVNLTICWRPPASYQAVSAATHSAYSVPFVGDQCAFSFLTSKLRISVRAFHERARGLLDRFLWNLILQNFTKNSRVISVVI